MRKPTILITGGNGQVAWDLKNHAQAIAHILAPAKDELDITDADAVKSFIKLSQPSLIVNTAAYTAVDKAEQEKDLAMRVNADGPANLAKQCAKQKIPLIHLSTDYIFDGKKNTGYLEDDPASPLNVYGESKWLGEQVVREFCEQHIILRVSAVFGFHGRNFVKAILRLAQEQEELKVVDDQITCPTPAEYIAETIIAIAKQILFTDKESWGTYHYRSSPPISWYDFAHAIINCAQHLTPLTVKTLTPIKTADMPRPAKRPAYSILVIDKVMQQFNICPKPWFNSLSNLLGLLTKHY